MNSLALREEIWMLFPLGLLLRSYERFSNHRPVGISILQPKGLETAFVLRPHLVP